MAKFIIVLCAFIATASAGPGLVGGPLSGSPFAYAQALSYSSPLTYASPLTYSSPLAYSSPLTYSASLAYTSPVAYGLAPGGSSRVDIQNNYNLAQQFAVPFAARIAAPYTAAAVQASLAPAPLSYNFAQLAAPQTAPVAFGAPLAAAPVAAAPLAKFASPVPAPSAAPQFIPAPLRYSAPVLSNFNAAANTAYYGSPLPYAFSGQINALPYTAAPGVPIAGQFATSPVQLAADPATAQAQTTRMTAVPSAENPEDDSEEVPAKLVSAESPASTEDQKFATPAPVDGPQQQARDASSGSQSPVAPVMRSHNNNNN